jgi:hypothetical protein
MEKLNCEMYKLAKDTMPFETSTVIAEICGAPWSIYLGGTKIIKNLQDRLYNHIHKEEIIHYWKDKGKTGPYIVTINWDTLGTTKKNSGLLHQWFVT